MEEKAVTARFTGPREMKTAEETVRRRLNTLMAVLTTKGVFRYCCGGAKGFDLLAAETVMERKQTDPSLQLILILPYKPRAQRPEADPYFHIKAQADQIIYTSETYFQGCMHRRNRQLVDRSRYCVALLERHQGGTFYTVQYALRQHAEVYDLAVEPFHIIM